MDEHDIAVVGLACVFPGATDAEAFWRNITNGVDALTPFPDSRWPRSGAPKPTTPGGFIPEPYGFDALRYRVTPNVARHGDADQFVVLDLAAKALADAGIGADHPCRRSTDVIIGRGLYGSAKMAELWYRSGSVDVFHELAHHGLVDPPTANGRKLSDAVDALLPPDDTDALASIIPNFVASRPANRLNLSGAAYTVDAACASTLVALEHGIDRLRSGRCDAAIVGGINFSHAPHFWYLFNRIGALSPTGRIRPFHRAGDGLLIGEGAGVLVLRRLRDAQADEERIYATIKGVGSASDGAAKGMLAPATAGQVLALQRAYADAGVDPETVSLVEGHGTGTALGDATELQSLAAFFGSPARSLPTRMLSSVKSMIGHTMPAAGAASLIKTVLALSSRVVPPSLHCEEPLPTLAETTFYVNTGTRPWAAQPDGPPRTAGVNAFGFGGMNVHVVLQEAPTGSRRRSTSQPRHPAGQHRPPPLRRLSGVHRPTELVAATGATPDELAVQLRRLASLGGIHQAGQARGAVPSGRGADVTDENVTLEDLAYTAARRIDMTHPFRAALVCQNLQQAAERMNALADDIASAQSMPHTTGNGVYQRAPGDDGGGRLVVIFPPLLPGLIGDLPNRLLDQCLHFPAARSVLDLVESRDRDPDDPLPTSYLLSPPAHLPKAERSRLRARFYHTTTGFPGAEDPRGTHPEERNLALLGALTSHWASWQILRSLHVEADAFAAFSLGHVSALCAAGVADFNRIMRQGWSSLSGMPFDAHSGALLSVPCSLEQLRDLVDLAPGGEVHIAFHLQPDLHILGGPRDAVREIAASLRAAGIAATSFSAPPVHTPFYADQAERVMAALRGTVEHPLSTASVYSALNADLLPSDPRTIEDVVAANFTAPVKTWQTLTRLREDGCRTFVQSGPGVIASLVNRLFPDHSAVASETLSDGQHPLTSIQHLCGLLFQQGRRLDLVALFDGRHRRELTLRDGQLPTSQGVVELHLRSTPWVVDGSHGGFVKQGVATGTTGVAAPRTRMPFLGKPVMFRPGQRIVSDVRLDLARDRYLEDHALLSANLDVQALQDCIPVMPLTMTMEMLAEQAAMLAPGLGLIGFQAVRASRWISFTDASAVDLRVEAAVVAKSPEAVTVEAQARVHEAVVASAVVRFAARYQQTLTCDFVVPPVSQRLPTSATGLYQQRDLFHGPRFRCIADPGERSDVGVTCDLLVLPRDNLFAGLRDPELLTDPVILDGVGQAVGLFFYRSNAILFPVGVDCLEFYRPAPPPGTRLKVRCQVARLDSAVPIISARIEVTDERGDVWLRIHGWQDRIWRWSQKFLTMQREPRRHLVGTAVPVSDTNRTTPENVPAAVAVAHEDLRGVPLDWLGRMFLHRDERAEFTRIQASSIPKAWEWIMARVTAKDAVRLWTARREGSTHLLHPSQIAISGEGENMQVIHIAGNRPRPPISVSGSDSRLIAEAGLQQSVGAAT